MVTPNRDLDPGLISESDPGRIGPRVFVRRMDNLSCVSTGLLSNPVFSPNDDDLKIAIIVSKFQDFAPNDTDLITATLVGEDSKSEHSITTAVVVT